MKYKSGWQSTKLHLALITSAVLTAVFIFVVWKTGSAAGFGEYCISLVTLVATYSGSRVSETYVQMKHGGGVIPPPSQPASPAGGS